jgi:redox-sensitive bicupin YhaK (pirin superfamily)
VFGPGDALTLAAAPRADGEGRGLDVLLLGGRPFEEPVVSYGPFVMNTRDEIMQAIKDYQSGRMGIIPARHLDARMGEPRG